MGHVIRPLWPMHIVHCDLVVGLPRALDGSYAILLLYSTQAVLMPSNFQCFEHYWAVSAAFR